MTTLLVAANGGHLTDLVELKPRLGVGDDVLWVTQPSTQSDSLLAGCRRFDAPRVDERDVRGVARAARAAQRLFREHDFDAVVSTGSGIALGFLPLAPPRRVRAVYIECSAFAAGPSVTGRLLQRMPGIELYTQHSEWARGRWRFAGSVYDGFVRKREPAPRPVNRVLVTLGSERWPFDRLVRHLAEIIPPTVEVTWQVGRSPVEDLGLPTVPYLPAREIEDAMCRADVVIAHAGCGSTFTALAAGRLPVLVPRDPARGECKDGHQRPYAWAMAERGLASARSVEALTFDDLCEAAQWRIERVASPEPMALGLGRQSTVGAVR